MLFYFQAPGGNQSSVDTREQGCAVSGKIKADFFTEPVSDAAENNAGQQEVADLDPEGCFHTGRHGGENLPFNGTVVTYRHKFRTDADDPVIAVRFGSTQFCVIDNRYRIFERNILICFFIFSFLELT